MTSALAVAGLLAGWGVAAVVIGLAVGRTVRMRERRRPGREPRRVTDLVGSGRTAPSRTDVLGD